MKMKVIAIAQRAAAKPIAQNTLEILDAGYYVNRSGDRIARTQKFQKIGVV
jgi:hypothetical protein